MIVCFIGHRKIKKDNELKMIITDTVVKLIESGADTFLFGSKSEFDDICWEIVTELKKVYTNIIRIYVRSSYPFLNENYQNYILQSYEKTYFPEKIQNAGKISYVERNMNMIDKSDICVFYFNKTYVPQTKNNISSFIIPTKRTNSGTKIAFDYAKWKKKQIINIFEQLNTTD